MFGLHYYCSTTRAFCAHVDHQYNDNSDDQHLYIMDLHGTKKEQKTVRGAQSCPQCLSDTGRTAAWVSARVAGSRKGSTYNP